MKKETKAESRACAVKEEVTIEQLLILLGVYNEA